MKLAFINRRGFTLIELLIVISIIGVLSTIGIFSYSSIQAGVRDTQRSNKVAILAEALEKYYDQNGEYPGCSAMSAATSTITSTTLKGVDPSIFSTPTSSNGTNSIQAGCNDLLAGSTSDVFAYVGTSSTNCVTGNSCLQYTLKYREETTGNIKTLTSRRSVLLIASPSQTPIITASLNGANAQGLVTNTPTCSVGTAQYAIASRLNDGSWGGFSAWSSVTPAVSSQTANQGMKYGYMAQVRCWVSDTSVSDTLTSNESTYTHPIATPAAPTVTTNTVSDTTTYSWNETTCPSGTTARYQYRYTINTSTPYDSGWLATTNTSFVSTTNTVGLTYTVAVQTQCYNGTIATSGWSTSGSGAYTKSSAWKSAAAGSGETCAISMSDQAYCWGTYSASGFENNLGYGYVTLPTSYISANTPTAINNSGVLAGKTIKKIAVSGANGCVIASDDKAYCWGVGTCGQLGVANGVQDSGFCVFGPNQPNPVPMLQGDIPNGLTIKDISMGSSHSCVIASNNFPYCMGDRSNSQVDASFSSGTSTVPFNSYQYDSHRSYGFIQMNGYYGGSPMALSTLSAGGSHNCVISMGGTAYCWGYFANWPGHYWTTDEPARVVGVNDNLSGKTVKSLSSGLTHACAIASDDKAYCWGGDNTYGQLGDGTNSFSSSGSNYGNSTIVTQAVIMSGVLSGKTLKSISAGAYHVCAVASDDMAYCWGRNDSGQLGNNSTTNSNVPVKVGGVLLNSTVKSIYSGGDHTCAIASDNAMYCWGGNGGGQLGRGNTAPSLVPVQVNSV